MPPHKAKHRANANHPQQAPQPPPLPSDYETDAPPPPIDLPPPPQRSNEELNLSVLRRKYPELVSILHVAPYAVLYSFNIESNQWEKLGIEGTLFLCQLTPSSIGSDRFSVVILNRRGLNNFDMEIASTDEMEITDEYVILQGDQVYGIWIFSEPPPSSTANCRVETAEKIRECAQRATQTREAKIRERENGVKEATEQVESASSVPMGRQLSLRELFGQQREQDAAWSLHNHQTHTHPNASNQHQQTHPDYIPTPSPQPAHNDVLGQLFMKAKQGYNGVG